jgi:PAP2 superfamily
MAHVSGGDAMIACFDAKYHYMFWRPAAAIALADSDGNLATDPDATWRPLRATPNFPEYPSAHACHSSAVTEALSAFFGTGEVHFSLESAATGTTRKYSHLHDAVREVEQARVLAGFHFRNSDLEGTILGRKVARFVIGRFSRPRD